MSRRIRIGNQTAFSAATPLEPFEFALANGFDAFEWFGDKKVYEDGSTSGWAIGDMDDSMRAEVRQLGEARDISYSVHAPWQANPLWADGNTLLLESLEFARSIGAGIVNLHLYMDEGPQGYVQALLPVIRRAAELGVRVSIENTPHTTPEDVNQTFAALRHLNGSAEHVGFCLDLGHANLCAPTRNDYIRYIDQLASEVPIIHAHVHENYGDADSHLTVFSGPAGDNDAGIRTFIRRLRTRRFSGALILEQWPEPRELLLQAERRLRPLLGHAGEKRRQNRGEHRATVATPVSPPEQQAGGAAQTASTRVTLDPKAISDPFISELVTGHQRHSSWRERLAWVGECLTQPDVQLSLGELATIAAYLRFLGTGEVPCAEDGRHFRPNHHARTALAIEEALIALESEDNAWVVRKILPWLPSHGDQFRRREPLTRIRDIAHRNDIPKELKREIKHRLQNKLHRCAGPEDLKTSEDILARITQPGSDYSPEFVNQFEIFHEELKEFFNATGIEQRLNELLPSLSVADAERARAFLDQKSKAGQSLADRGALLGALTELRQALTKYQEKASGAVAQRLRLTDIGLEDYAFVLSSEFANALEQLAMSDHWQGVLSALRSLVANIRLSQTDPHECAAIESELARWSEDFDPSSAFELRRLLATLDRAQRLGEGYSDRLVNVFADRVNLLGTALGVPQHAIQIFCEGDIRGNIVFQLSKLVEMARAALRRALKLPPWEALVAGEALGRLVATDELGSLTSQSDPLVILLGHAEGDEEIPPNVRGILLAHPIPHLSHLGVRARQARVPFASADARNQLEQFQPLVNNWVKLSVGADQLGLERAEEDPRSAEELPKSASRLLTATPTSALQSVSVTAAESASCGSKAAAAGQLLVLAEESGLFRAPRGRVLPFGVMEACLSLDPELQARYQALQQMLTEAPSDEREQRLGELQALLKAVPIPPRLSSEIEGFFGTDARLAVRSSANGEDLEEFAGAGLYESVIGVAREELAQAVQTVWASLWTRRAAVSRTACGIAHEQIRMAVLIQDMVPPELSFIMHTADPVTGRRDRASVELALGLGETLASAVQPGRPYRLICDRRSRQVQLTQLASFSFALRSAAQSTSRERVDYSLVPWSLDSGHIERFGPRFMDIAELLEARFGSPQDVEGVIADDAVYLVQSRPQQGLS